VFQLGSQMSQGSRPGSSLDSAAVLVLSNKVDRSTTAGSCRIIDVDRSADFMGSTLVEHHCVVREATTEGVLRKGGFGTNISDCAASSALGWSIRLYVAGWGLRGGRINANASGAIKANLRLPGKKPCTRKRNLMAASTRQSELVNRVKSKI
jgi:hypothetical protein